MVKYESKDCIEKTLTCDMERPLTLNRHRGRVKHKKYHDRKKALIHKTQQQSTEKVACRRIPAHGIRYGGSELPTPLLRQHTGGGARGSYPPPNDILDSLIKKLHKLKAKDIRVIKFYYSGNKIIELKEYIDEL